MGMFFNEDINTLFVGGTSVSAVYMESEQVWPVGLPVGTTFDFDYTGTVQSVELPKGKYKLQCWGAQGGSVTGTYAVAGSKGGYSEGILTLTETTTLYVFVGGQGTSYTSAASQTSTTVINGGWNGGGAGVRTARYNSSNTDGRSFPRGGGGATDISTVTSDLSYSSGRTTRDSASLLARCIVAGGGAGASARYTSVTTTTATDFTEIYSGDNPSWWTDGSGYKAYYWDIPISYFRTGYTYKLVTDAPTSDFAQIKTYFANSNSSIASTILNSSTYTTTIQFTPTISSNYAYVEHSYRYTTEQDASSFSFVLYEALTETSTSNSSAKSTTSKQGGGTSGKGQYPGTQSSAGNNGAFGLGASQTITNYRYCGGGGGGGWYGGGTSYSDSSTSYINYCGGGSGFVNTSANASYRPSGYTGLELDSGTTTAGSSSFESTSGGTETGHSGNGYARITVIE